MSVQTTLSSCAGGISGITYTTEYPLAWDSAQYYYDGDGNLVLIEFFIGTILQFRHIITYDAEGNITSKTIE